MENGDYKDLINFLGKKFDQIDSKFDQMDGRFEQMDGRFEQMDGRFEHIEKNMATKKDLDDLRKATNKDIDDLRAATKKDLEGMASELRAATKKDIENLERRTGVLFEDVAHKIDLVIEGQQGILQKLDRHIDYDDAEHKRLEHMVMEDRADIYNIKKKLT